MLTEQFFSLLQETTSAKKFCLALSGGLDSTVLLHLLTSLRNRDSSYSLRAIHVNHGLSPESDNWSKFCEQLCLEWQVPFILRKISLHKNKQSLEELARKARYQELMSSLQPDEVLLTGHHQNDQAETLLLQLFRGAGPKGLASMPLITTLGQGYLLRPLLYFPRQQIHDYACSQKLQWIEDESNQANHFDRNFLRNELLPLLEKRWPKVVANLARSASHCADANDFIDAKIEAIFKSCLNDNKTLDIHKLLMFDKESQNYVLRYWLQHLNLPLPSTKKLQMLRSEILQSRVDANPLLTWKEVEIRRFQGNLYALSPLLEFNSSVVMKWDLTSDLILPNGLGTITLQDVSQLGLDPQELHNVTIRFRQGGERCRLKNRQHSSSLKKLFQLWQVPTWLRDRVPLLFCGEKIQAILGYAACE